MSIQEKAFKQYARVFVYGSLRQGMGNHGLMGESELIQQDVMMYPGYMVSLGNFPAVMRTNEDLRQIRGEVYDVTKETMSRLDMLEGYPSFYNREQRNTKSGILCWVYFLDGTKKSQYYGNRDIVEHGDWVAYREGGKVLQRPKESV
jgi:gamma-glutamylcyclotransferase (GGCT)/AIG2-like uncharacterized protein YtfP